MHRFNAYTSGERRLLSHNGVPEHHEPMNAGEREPTYKEQRWQKLTDALTSPEQYQTTVGIFRTLEKDFTQGKIDKEYLKAAHEYVESIANQSGMKRNDILMARPLSMKETYEFVCFVLDNAANGPSTPRPVREETVIREVPASAPQRTASGFRPRPSAQNAEFSVQNDPEMNRAREQRHLPIEETDLYKKASPRAQERALRIQQLSRELTASKERERSIRYAGGRIRELRVRYDQLIGAVKDKMKSTDPATRADAEKLYKAIQQKERMIERDVAARWPNYKRPTPDETMDDARLHARTDEWVSRATYIADSYSELQRGIEQRMDGTEDDTSAQTVEKNEQSDALARTREIAGRLRSYIYECAVRNMTPDLAKLDYQINNLNAAYQRYSAESGKDADAYAQRFIGVLNDRLDDGSSQRIGYDAARNVFFLS